MEQRKKSLTVLNRLSVSFKELLVDTLAHRKARCRVQVALWVRLDVLFENLKYAKRSHRRFTMSQSTQTHTQPTTFTPPRPPLFLHLTDTRRKLDFENILGPSYKYRGVGDAFGGGSQ